MGAGSLLVVPWKVRRSQSHNYQQRQPRLLNILILRTKLSLFTMAFPSTYHLRVVTTILLAILGAHIPTTHAVAFRGPSSTVDVAVNLAQSPPTARPDLSFHNLAARAISGEVCGYVEGSTDRGWGCVASGMTCRLSSTLVACCAQTGDCIFSTTCYDSTEQSSCTGSCTASNSVWYVET